MPRRHRGQPAQRGRRRRGCAALGDGDTRRAREQQHDHLARRGQHGAVAQRLIAAAADAEGGARAGGEGEAGLVGAATSVVGQLEVSEALDGEQCSAGAAGVHVQLTPRRDHCSFHEGSTCIRPRPGRGSVRVGASERPWDGGAPRAGSAVAARVGPSVSS